MTNSETSSVARIIAGSKRRFNRLRGLTAAEIEARAFQPRRGALEDRFGSKVTRSCLYHSSTCRLSWRIAIVNEANRRPGFNFRSAA